MRQKTSLSKTTQSVSKAVTGYTYRHTRTGAFSLWIDYTAEMVA